MPGGKAASIGLNCGKDAVSLKIEDDGIGFHSEEARSSNSIPRGFGILGMRERIADLSGTLAVRSTPGMGTTITAELPLKEARP